MKQIFKMLTKPSSERIASLKSTFPQPLIFGVVSTNRKLVPNRVEIWSMFNKVQVVELIFKTYLCSNFLSTLFKIIF